MTRRRLMDWFEPAGPAEPGEDVPAGRKLVWFAALSVAGLIVVAVSAYILRGLLLIAQ